MDEGTIRILEYLEPYQPGDRQNIGTLLNEIIPINHPNAQSIELYFIEALREYINFDSHYNRSAQFGFGHFPAFIKQEGRDFLKEYRKNKLEERAHNSAISVNESLIGTNEAVKNTNIRMLEHADRQEVIMHTQTGFTERQVKFTETQLVLFEKQNNLYKITLVLTALNIILGGGILFATLNANADKQAIERLNTQITSQSKALKQLQILKSDTVRYVLHYPLLKSNLIKKKP